MKVLERGHDYLLDSYDGGDSVRLTFLKREGAKYPGNVGKHPGTNCQEVLRALIERTKYLNAQIPCAETEAVIRLLQATLLLFETRAAGKHDVSIDSENLDQLTAMVPCKICGHVFEHDHSLES